MPERKIPDNKNGVPLEHYCARFAAMRPEDMSFRSGFEYCGGAFKLRYLGGGVRLTYPDMRLFRPDGAEISAPAARILIGRAVMEAWQSRPTAVFSLTPRCRGAMCISSSSAEGA